ncbi:MAG: hypothetical protein LBS25_06415, partial [Candidatus Symbiothrix sp.]|nr:hypothetical protein [Candidatus Symbiothrix sp.]
MFHTHRTKTQIALFSIFLLGMLGVGVYKIIHNRLPGSSSKQAVENQATTQSKTKRTTISEKTDLPSSEVDSSTERKQSVVKEPTVESVELFKTELKQIY